MASYRSSMDEVKKMRDHSVTGQLDFSLLHHFPAQTKMTEEETTNDSLFRSYGFLIGYENDEDIKKLRCLAAKQMRELFNRNKPLNEYVKTSIEEQATAVYRCLDSEADAGEFPFVCFENYIPSPTLTDPLILEALAQATKQSLCCVAMPTQHGTWGTAALKAYEMVDRWTFAVNYGPPDVYGKNTTPNWIYIVHRGGRFHPMGEFGYG